MDGLKNVLAYIGFFAVVILLALLIARSGLFTWPGDPAPAPQSNYAPAAPVQEYVAPQQPNPFAGSTNSAPVNESVNVVETQKVNMTAYAEKMNQAPTPIPTLYIYGTVTVCRTDIPAFREPNFGSEPVAWLTKGQVWNLVGRNNDTSWVAIGVDGVYAMWVPYGGVCVELTNG